MKLKRRILFFVLLYILILITIVFLIIKIGVVKKVVVKDKKQVMKYECEYFESEIDENARYKFSIEDSTGKIIHVLADTFLNKGYHKIKCCIYDSISFYELEKKYYFASYKNDKLIKRAKVQYIE